MSGAMGTFDAQRNAGKTLLAMASGGLVFAALMLPGRSIAAPAVAWQPEVVSATVIAGRSTNLSITFTAEETIGNAKLDVVPALQPFVTVTPQTITNVSKGQSVTATL